jgi:hypothetical protein
MTNTRLLILAVTMLAGCQRDLSVTTQASTGGDTYGSGGGDSDAGGGGPDGNDALDAFLSDGPKDGPNDCDPPCAPCVQECKKGQCVDDPDRHLCPDGWCAYSSSCPSDCNPPCAYCVENCVNGACVPNPDVHLCPDGVSCEVQLDYCPSNCDPPCETCTEWCANNGTTCKSTGNVLCGDVCKWPGSVCNGT